ncbi:MAG: DUF5666 domain-containing protein, partial [Gammaproteobacteria bacterium]|nr:DUF5666 domain-containing protein [Gammaproteobacteria bacterium]
TTTYTGSVGSGSTAAAFTGLDQLAAGNVLDVVGLFNEDGSLQAGAINYVADTFVVDEMTISVTGPVSGLETTAMAFNINAATVDYASAELLDFPVAEDGTPAISDGQIVTVESTAGVNDFGAVVAASVRFVAAPQVTSAAGGAATTVDLLGTNLVLLQGRVTSVSAGGTSIVVNGVTIFVGSAPINRVVATAAGRRSPIAVNALVIVAGRVGANGAFVAEDVSILNGHVPVKLEAPVESYDAETNTLTFLGVVSVAVTDVTLFEDTTIEDIAAALEAGETPTLEVEADFHEDGTLVAHSIELEDGALVDAPVKLRGPAANIDADAQQFDILGVVIVVADETIYVLDGADVPAADFFAALSEAEEPNVKATGAFDGETGEITAAMLSLRTAAADPALNAARKDVARIAGGVPAQSPPK